MTDDAYAAIPLTGLRGVIASRMVASLQTTAQLTFHLECDATALLDARAAAGDAAKPGVEDLLIVALARALARHRGANGLVQGDEIRLYEAIRIGVAIAVGERLMVPALPDARGVPAATVASWRSDLVARARAGRLAPSEMTRGTFTLSNLGHRGVHYFTPVLNAPQIAILGVGALRRRPEVKSDGRLVACPILPLSLTVDHRALDGDPAAHFLSDLRAEIEAFGG